MKIVTFHLANHAEVRESLLFVSGGFPEWWNVQFLPSPQNLAVVAVAELDSSELDLQHDLELGFVRPSSGRDDAEIFGRVSFVRPEDSTHPEGAPYFQQVAVNVGLEFREEGRHQILVRSDGHVLAQAALVVRLV